MPNPRSRYLVINLVLAFVLGNCSPPVINSSTATFVMTKVEPSLAPTFTFSPTQVPVPTPSVPPEPTPDPSAFLLKSFRMVSDTIGWGITEIPDYPGDYGSPHILHTADGGLNWLDISPPSEPERRIEDTFFLDQDNAWVVTTLEVADSSQEPAVIVWHTRNGGRTWDKGEPFSHTSQGWVMSFADARHGWLMSVDNVAAGSVWITLYRTEDSGINWKVIRWGSPGDEPPPEAIPNSCHKEFLGFRDASTGWVMGECGSGNVLFEMTMDGGLSWRPQTLLPPSNDPAFIFSPSCTPYPPTFFSLGEGTLQIICETTDLLIYHTHDGGRTWEVPAHRSRMILTTLVDFVDSNNGWHFGSQDIPDHTSAYGFYVTHDGGQTWSEITPIINLSEAYDLPPSKVEAIHDFDFINPEMGWAALTIGSDEYSLILKTTDGGFTWTYWVPHLQLAEPGH